DRSRLGGNASSEIRMHIVGADHHGGRAGWREGGILEELRLENAKWNPHSAWELWDLMLYDKCVSEPNLKLILDTSIYRAEMKDENTIDAIWARCDKTEHLYHIKAPLFVDATGDSRLGLESGAAYRVGRERYDEFNESLAGYDQEGMTMGSSILFTAREHDRPIPYRPPTWARKLSAEHFQHRGIGSYEYGYWWIELGGVYDTIRDNEQLRFELLAVVLGVWDFIKNSGEHPDSENWALETVGMIPGKRESRRLEGDIIMTQNDLDGDWRNFTDAVAIGGWPFDDHPSLGFDAHDESPYRSIPVDDAYNVAFGSLYSRNIHNLFMAGRNISVSHVAFGSTRVMGTCAVAGQAAGTAAAICAREGWTPSELREDSSRIRRLQQRLLRDDQTIREVTNEDPDDLARRAEASASSVVMDGLPEYVINGLTRDMPGEVENRWMGDMEENGDPWIELTWDEPETIGHVQLLFDSGFHRELTLTAQYSRQNRMELGPQPETVKDYTLTAVTPNREEVTLAEVEYNYQRLCRHTFDPIEIEALRLTVHATNGNPEARVYEIRCYETE
ncbi:MAG: FAD-dependent oxidoreductase, partial [Candidatus Hydrogenedentota bacterium]